MFPGLPPKKPSPPAEVVAPDSEKKPHKSASTDGKRPVGGSVPFSASPYKKLAGSQPSWIKMDLSLMPREIADELGVDFNEIDTATTGAAKILPEKLRPTAVDDQTTGLVGQLLAANWGNAPDALKQEIKKFLDGEISRTITGEPTPEDGAVGAAEKMGHLPDPNLSEGDTLWGKEKDLDQLIS